MRVLQRGHTYSLDHRAPKHNEKPLKSTEVQFVNMEKGQEVEGTTTQEVLRMLIDRTRYCNNCLPHEVNERIIHHLRMALVLHECRAMERAAMKGEFMPEFVKLNEHGHYILEEESIIDLPTSALMTLNLDPPIKPGEEPCKHSSHM